MHLREGGSLLLLLFFLFLRALQSPSPFERTPLVPWEQFSTLTKLASEEKRVLEEEEEKKAE